MDRGLMLCIILSVIALISIGSFLAVFFTKFYGSSASSGGDSGVSCSCQNGGSCLADGSCSCVNGYYGTTCQSGPSSSCSCINGGVCQTGNTCSCPTGYYGTRCELITGSSCSCINGGVCQTGNTCSCPSGYYGTRCELITAGAVVDVTKQTGSSCTASSEAGNYGCTNAMDGDTNPGPGSEWSSFSQGDGAWINVTFSSMVNLQYMKIWSSCANSDQYQRMDFLFSDLSTYPATRSCNGGANENACPTTARFDVFTLTTPKLTRWVHMTGQQDCAAGGSNGFIELEYWGSI